MMQTLVNTAVNAKKASVTQCCRLFGVSRSGLYAARQRQRQRQAGQRAAGEGQNGL